MPDESLRYELPGGVMPDPIEIFQDTWKEFADDPGPYVLAGLGQLVVIVPVIMVLFVVIYFGIFATLFGGIFIGAIAAAIVGETVGPEAGGLTFMITYILSFFLMFFVIMLASSGVGALMAPINASLTRRIAKHQRGEQTLDFTAAFTDMKQDLVNVILLAMLSSAVILVGVMLCYVPGLIAAFLLIYAGTFVFLHRLKPMEAMMASVNHFRDHLQFHGMFTLLYFCTAMIASYIPVAGPMFVAALHVRAHRTLFGDGEEPVLEPLPKQIEAAT